MYPSDWLDMVSFTYLVPTPYVHRTDKPKNFSVLFLNLRVSTEYAVSVSIESLFIFFFPSR